MILDTPPSIEVAAGVIRDAAGRVLLARRPEGGHLGGLWEFPGGKIEPGESAEQALRRELAEELGIRPGPVRPLVALRHEYPDKIVRLRLFEVHGFAGTVHGREGQPLCWANPSELAEFEMPAADRPMIGLLQLDGYYAISPTLSELGRSAAFLAAWQACLDAGFRLLGFRPGPEARVDAALIEQIDRITRAAGARWIAAGALEQCFGWPADGIHLETRELVTLDRRPLPRDKLMLATCHDLEEIRIADDLGFDLVTLAPIEPTAAEPAVEPMGWDNFARVVNYAPLPVLAQGGVRPDHWQRARALGAFGVAGQHGFGWDVSPAGSQ